jgi:hypothetical protein
MRFFSWFHKRPGQQLKHQSSRCWERWLGSLWNRTSKPSPRRRKRYLALLEGLEDRIAPATVSWVGGSGDWANLANWRDDTGVNRLPGPGDDAIINVTGISVTHNLGSHTVQSLTVNDAFSLAGGTLTVTGNLQVQNNNTFALGGGTLAIATVTAGTTITATGNGALTGVTLAGTLGINSGVTVTANQGLTLSGGAVQLNGFSNSGDTNSSRVAQLLLAGAGTQTLGGTGQVLLAGTFNGRPAPFVNVVASSGGPLALAAGVSVVNTAAGNGGTLGSAGQPLTLNGPVTASGGQTIIVTGSAVTNRGPGGGPAGLQANGGTLTISNLQGNAGGIAATSNGTVALSGAWQNSGTISETSSTLILGGTFTTAGLGTLSTSGGTVNLTGTLSNSGATWALPDTGRPGTSPAAASAAARSPRPPARN